MTSKTKGRRKSAKTKHTLVTGAITFAEVPKFKPCGTCGDLTKEAHERAAPGENKDLLAHALVIRYLVQRSVRDIIEIGHRLSLSKDIIEHGNKSSVDNAGWAKWLKENFGWTTQTALNFTRVYELSKSKNFLDLKIAPSALYLLAQPSTPEEVQDKIFEAAEAGEAIKVKAVKEELKKEQEPGDEPEAPTPASDEGSEDESEASGDEPERTKDWRKDLRGGFAAVLKVANDAYKVGTPVPEGTSLLEKPLIGRELRRQMREVLEPLKAGLPEIEAGGRALLQYFYLVTTALADDEPEESVTAPNGVMAEAITETETETAGTEPLMLEAAE